MGFKSSQTRIWVVVILFVMASVLVGCNRSATKAEPTAEPEEGQTVEETPTQSMDSPTVAPEGEATAEPTEGEGEQEMPAEGEETTEPEATDVLTVEATEPAAEAEATAVPATKEPAGDTTYTIAVGDTLFSIAQAYGLTVEELAAYNGITDVNQLEVGQVITIPAPGSEPPEPAAEPTEPAAEPAGEQIHIVQPGENLFRIALQYNLSFETVAAYNGIPGPIRFTLVRKSRFLRLNKTSFFNSRALQILQGSFFIRSLCDG